MIPPAWVMRRPHWPLIALIVMLAAQVPFYTTVGLSGPPHSPLLTVPMAAAACALQLRHSLYGARGERPAGWPWTLTALVLLANVPLPWLEQDWEALGILVIASAALLRGWAAWTLAAVQLAISEAVGLIGVIETQHGSATFTVVIGIYNVLIPVLYAGAIVGGTRLVQLVNELYATRTELAANAVGQERARLSRDLHDLLGQSLSAISLKGDLALRLLAKDPEAARAEVESLTEVARDALHDTRAITRDEHAVSLRTEIDGAATLLGAAGVQTRLDVADLPSLSLPVQSALAWAVREGTTNLLRHSQAQSCVISLSRRDGTVRLEIVNDGVRTVAGHGSGLSGVAERARAVAGSSTATVRDGRFRLRIEVPEEAL
ncbi:two-component sensor histidine kinase [Actinomadura barringtoniae]|uniref:Two-component sensor histidine kinase n=1 Tax=Actinomadura barringtoniae TaxID=1427535 RepID=A0A939TE01_9ACTN|nr:histidine kinase [Actinomadura barringtoniae]MBO2452830.1 two-component sensor histidine kinase [Actinomadura barringtoniae]